MITPLCGRGISKAKVNQLSRPGAGFPASSSLKAPFLPMTLLLEAVGWSVWGNRSH